MSPRDPWPPLSINLGAETATSLAALSQQAAANAAAIAALQADAASHVLRSGDTMSGGLGWGGGTLIENDGAGRLRVKSNGRAALRVDSPALGTTRWYFSDETNDYIEYDYGSVVEEFKVVIGSTEVFRVTNEGGNISRWFFSAEDNDYIEYDSDASPETFKVVVDDEPVFRASKISSTVNRWFPSNNANSYIDYDHSNGRLQVTINGTERLRVDGAALSADDGNTGLKEIFPKGTLIEMSSATSGVDIANVSATEAEQAATVQTVACDHASQPVYVEVSVAVLWKGLAVDQLIRCRPTVNGVAKGMKTGDRFTSTTTDATAGGDNVDVDGSTDADATGASSTSHVHTLSAGNYGTNIADGHAHTLPDVLSQTNSNSAGHSHSHSHTSGTLAVNGTHIHSHAHQAVPTNITQTITWRGTASADGSGNITLGIAAESTGGTADIEEWSVSWAVWRR